MTSRGCCGCLHCEFYRTQVLYIFILLLKLVYLFLQMSPSQTSWLLRSFANSLLSGFCYLRCCGSRIFKSLSTLLQCFACPAISSDWWFFLNRCGHMDILFRCFSIRTRVSVNCPHLWTLSPHRRRSGLLICLKEVKYMAK
jgi:hypothetical protein